MRHITDTGAVREMLDVAERRWPGLERRERQRRAMREVAALVHADVLLSDAAWH